MLNKRQKNRIYSIHHLPNIISLDVNKLGRPYHKNPTVFTDSFDILDAKISAYFLRKYRLNVALDDMTFEMDKPHKYAQVFATQFGNVGFDIDRPLLLNILNDYYGLGKDNNPATAPKDVPVTKTEERLKNKLGLELSPLMFHPGIFGHELEIRNDYSNVMNRWSYRITIALENHPEGKLHFFMDNRHVDRLLAKLRCPDDQGDKAPQSLSSEQLERIYETLPVRFTGRLSTTNLTVAELMNIKAGDVLPVSLPNRFPVLIGKEHLYSAVIAEDNGKLYFSEFNENINETSHE